MLLLASNESSLSLRFFPRGKKTAGSFSYF